jgi:protein-tyrosine kinase
VRPMHHDAGNGAHVQPRRPIGSFLRDARTLSDDQIERILAYQRSQGVRFGEAAVSLRFADRTDVLDALSRQFQYTTGFVGRQASTELVTAADPFGDQADAFRELRSRLLLEVLDEHQRSALAIVSLDAGDGKSYVCANLAVAFSQLGARTLLLDADIRTPRQAQILGVEHEAGLSSVLAGFADVAGTVQSVPGLPNLYLLPGGPVPPNPLELLQRPAFGAIVRDMLQKFEHVIIDTPAAIRGSDARVIAAQCGAVLVVGRKDRSRMATLEGFVASLARGPTRVAGVVMNDH